MQEMRHFDTNVTIEALQWFTFVVKSVVPFWLHVVVECLILHKIVWFLPNKS